ncbi:hypothetical protein W97_02416 [Coniosporium apollinis CBS 100218]|uniref:Cytochrome P450 n=1 Tax=Coniosporium apollinis (strain CBS 100218) TaxID=1168221 RepID=R7YN11_CONA1|nr:uncharacterized protein W97_02416 [Coniosporium apollinis CBS 100218]EON63189.1 hypothetical protein W97_02416 [Coniosporium apollinis CBS 100218]
MALITFLVFAAIVVAVGLYKHLTSKPKIPKGLKPLPGPKGYPIIGSVPDVPEKNGFIKFAEWGKEYGPIYNCNLAGSNHVWISSDKIAKDLLAKRAAIYSARPHIPALLDDNRTSAQYLPLLSNNDGWSRQRKFANAIMREAEKANWHHYPELEAKRLLVELLDDPSQYNHHLESFIARITCRLAWGHSEPSNELKQRARELLIGVSPTGALGNKLPFLMAMPDWMSPVKAWERRRAATERRFFQMMEEQVETEIKEKRAPPSWMRMAIEGGKEQWNFQYKDEGAYCVGMHGIAGALTIAAPMQTFCLAMCYYPQYQHLVQEEIDRVCGDRMPQPSDRPNMPVLRAFIREALRWRPPVPTGIPHYLIQDDEYEGYHIPAGTTMHPLEWAISRDPELYPDPEEFNPLRWLKPEYPTYKEPLTEFPTMFTGSTQAGYGRRLCMGSQVADEDMFIGIGSLAWLFHISKEDAKRNIMMNEKASISEEELNTGLDEDSDASSEKSQEVKFDPTEVKAKKESKKEVKKDEMDPTLDYSILLIAKPLPFKFDLKVRKPERVEIVRRQFEDGMEKGLYESPKNYWGDNKGKLGWGKV